MGWIIYNVEEGAIIERGGYLRKRVLVTGGLGFIGSRLVERLVGLGARVAVVDNLDPACGGEEANVAAVRGEIDLFIGDASDAAILRDALSDADCVFHLAGSSSHSHALRAPHDDLSANAATTLSLLAACRRRNPPRVVFASSRSVYGRASRLPVGESHPLAPLDINGMHKRLCEEYIDLHRRLYGLPACVLRLTNTYGPRQGKKAHLGLFPAFLAKLAAGEPIEVYGDGSQERDFVFVEDAVEALLLAGESPRAAGQVYNLGHDERHRVVDLARRLIAAWGSGRCVVRPYPPEAAATEVGSFQGDYRLIAKHLAWRPRVGLAEGLEKTLKSLAIYSRAAS